MLKAGVSVPGAAQLAQDHLFCAAAECQDAYLLIKSLLNLIQKIIGMGLNQTSSLL